MNRCAWLIAAMILLTASAAAAESYVCVADHATGFGFNRTTRKWEPTTFKADEKFVVRRPRADELKDVGNKASWVVSRLGTNFAISWCPDDFTDQGYLVCRGLEEFSMNRKSLRYLSVYRLGYVTGVSPQNEGADTPGMQIGMCSSL